MSSQLRGRRGVLASGEVADPPFVCAWPFFCPLVSKALDLAVQVLVDERDDIVASAANPAGWYFCGKS